MFRATFYNSEIKYTKEDCTEYTEEELLEKYPTIKKANMVVWLYDSTTIIEKVMELGYAQSIYGSTTKETEEKTLLALTDARISKDAESSPLERIASALEYLVMLNKTPINSTSSSEVSE